MSAALASVPDAGPNASYAWTVTGATFTGQGTHAIVFTAAPSGSVSLSITVQNASGCSATDNTSVPIVSGPILTDDPLIINATPIRAIHLSEVRDAA